MKKIYLFSLLLLLLPNLSHANIFQNDFNTNLGNGIAPIQTLGAGISGHLTSALFKETPTNRVENSAKIILVIIESPSFSFINHAHNLCTAANETGIESGGYLFFNLTNCPSLSSFEFNPSFYYAIEPAIVSQNPTYKSDWYGATDTASYPTGYGCNLSPNYLPPFGCGFNNINDYADNGLDPARKGFIDLFFILEGISSNNSPSNPTSLQQYKSDGATLINESQITTESEVIFKATINDPNNDQVKLQLEIKEFSQLFDETNLLESAFISSGTEVSVIRENLSEGQYHWRARAVDINGNASDWQEFGIAGNVDFKVKLVPLYTQVRSPYPSDDETKVWAEILYADGLGNTGDDPCGLFIKDCGCAITSAVMLLRYHKIFSAVDDQDTNPKNFNNWLNGNSGYTNFGNLYWQKASEYSKNSPLGLARLRFDGPIDFKDSNTLNNYLAAAKPVIIKNSQFGHFLIADGILGNTYTVKDPAWYNTKKLDETATNRIAKIRDYNNFFDGLRLYSAVLTGVDGISLNLASPAEMLVIDPLGRRLGKDPITNISYNEIPDGSYGSEGIGNADSEIPIVVQQTKNIWIPHTETGQYILQVIGTETGTYTLDSLIYDAQSNGHNQTFIGATTINTITNFNINATPGQPENINVKPADLIPPEVKIFFDPAIKQLKINGIDNIIQPAPVVTQQNRIFTVQDAASNTLTLTFDKLRQEGQQIKAELASLQYNSELFIKLPKTELKYEWSVDKKTNQIKELEQRIKAKNQFDIKAKYYHKQNRTEIKIKLGDQKPEQKQILPGLVVIKLITKSGDLDFEF